jgi:branched-chain amino acid transport system ATP-binding protein
VIERGSIQADGPAALLARSTVIREAYLGSNSTEKTTTAKDAVRRKQNNSNLLRV